VNPFLSFISLIWLFFSGVKVITYNYQTFYHRVWR